MRIIYALILSCLFIYTASFADETTITIHTDSTRKPKITIVVDYSELLETDIEASPNPNTFKHKKTPKEQVTPRLPQPQDTLDGGGATKAFLPDNYTLNISKVADQRLSKLVEKRDEGIIEICPVLFDTLNMQNDTWQRDAENLDLTVPGRTLRSIINATDEIFNGLFDRDQVRVSFEDVNEIGLKQDQILGAKCDDTWADQVKCRKRTIHTSCTSEIEKLKEVSTEGYFESNKLLIVSKVLVSKNITIDGIPLNSSEKYIIGSSFNRIENLKYTGDQGGGSVQYRSRPFNSGSN